MNTKILEYILAIEEEGSVSKAADKFLLTQPVISRHLKKIEDSLGTQLFTRGKNGMVPTAAGVIFLNNAQAILHAEQQLNQKLQLMKRQQQGSLRVLLSSQFQNFFFRVILPRYQAAWPENAMEIYVASENEAKAQLMHQEADLAIFNSGTLEEEAFRYLPVLSNQMLPVYSSTHPQAKYLCNQDQMYEAMNHSLFVLYPQGTDIRRVQEQWLAGRNIRPNAVFDSQTFHMAIGVIAGVPACSLIPDGLYKTLDPASFHVIPVQELCCLYTVIAWLDSAPLSEAARNLIEIVRDGFSEFLTYRS